MLLKEVKYAGGYQVNNHSERVSTEMEFLKFVNFFKSYDTSSLEQSEINAVVDLNKSLSSNMASTNLSRHSYEFSNGVKLASLEYSNSDIKAFLFGSNVDIPMSVCDDEAAQVEQLLGVQLNVRYVMEIKTNSGANKDFYMSSAEESTVVSHFINSKLIELGYTDEPVISDADLAADTNEFNLISDMGLDNFIIGEAHVA